MHSIHLQLTTILISLFVGNLYAQDTLENPAPATSAYNSLEISADTLLEESSGLEKEPQLISFIKAKIPQEYIRKGITGTVNLDLLVDSTGAVDSLYITKGIDPVIDSAVAAAVRQFTFSPAVSDGQPVAVILSYEYTITLDDEIHTIEEYVNFSGTVLEKGTRTPVRDADIAVFFTDTTADTTLKIPFGIYLQKIGTFKNQILSDKWIITQTDSTGKFFFKSLATGPVRVNITLLGYEPFSSMDTVFPNESVDITYRIQRTDYSDNEIVVYGKAEPKEVARRTLTVKEIRKIPGFSGDAVKVIQALPGVARPSIGGGAIVVRGSPTWDSKFYLDGIEIPQLYHFGGVKSTYLSDALGSIDFYPGGFGVRYGSTLAGAIELKSRPATQEKAKGFVDVNLLDATAFVESPVSKKVGITASVRRSYFGDILKSITKSELFELPVTVMPYYFDYLIRTDFTPVDNHNLFVSLFGSKDKLELIAPFIRGGSKEIDELSDRLNQMVGFTMVTGGADSKFSEKTSNSLRFGFVNNTQSGSIFGFVKFGSASREYSLKDQFTYKISDKLKLTAGFDLWMENSKQRSALPAPDNTFVYDTSEYDLGLVGAYLECQYRPIQKLQLIPGIRYDYYKELQYDGGIVPELWKYTDFNNRRGISGEPSLRITTRYSLSKDHTLKAAVGTYNQTPQPSLLTINKSFGNPYLPASKARHIVAGYEWQITELISADVQVYHNQQWDIPEFYTDAELAQRKDPSLFNEKGENRMYGLEILLKHDQNDKLFGWIAYTLARSEGYDLKTNTWSLYNRDQTHNLQLVLNYRLKKQWEIGTRIRYISGNPYTPVLYSTNNTTERLYEATRGEPNSLRNDPFFQVDLRVDKKFIYNKWMFSLYIDLQNVSYPFYKSPEFTFYNFDAKSTATLYSPFIPSFGVRAEF
ncbi:MAG: TonB-dependent receptor [Fibrobacter sp.]|nr:TonB-dependent receptor [Fibrobacter sp.]